ncbi:MAG: ribulose-phosphate 3-epimerase [Calditrichia bacterium]
MLDEVRQVDIPEIQYLHIDVMDGHFVPNFTFGPAVVKSLKKNTRFKLDVHLMVANPVDHIRWFAEAGADIITIHQETDPHLDRQIHFIKESGAKAGISLNPSTPLETIRWLLKEIDLVLVMSVNPGFGGQKFIPYSLDKIAQLKKMREEAGATFRIEVDGGIDSQTAPMVIESGAEMLVAGNAIFGQEDRQRAIRAILNSIAAGTT